MFDIGLINQQQQQQQQHKENIYWLSIERFLCKDQS